jgi:hypothetical protein
LKDCQNHKAAICRSKALKTNRNYLVDKAKDVWVYSIYFNWSVYTFLMVACNFSLISVLKLFTFLTKWKIKYNFYIYIWETIVGKTGMEWTKPIWSIKIVLKGDN